jgi:hypothetical protein
MSARLSLGTLGFLGVVLVACNSSTDGGANDARSDHALEYLQPCTPADCDASAIPMIGCADGSTPTLSCAPGDDGACHVELECGDDGVSSGDPGDPGDPNDPDEPVSYEPCDPSECGAIPQIGCPSDYTLVESCGSVNGNACTWAINCIPPASTTPCATPDGCGPMPELGVICDDGSVGTLACMETDNDCSWQPQCP